MQGLGDVSDIQLLVPFSPDTYSYQMFGIRTSNRDQVMIKLKSKGIALVVIIHPFSAIIF